MQMQRKRQITEQNFWNNETDSYSLILKNKADLVARIQLNIKLKTNVLIIAILFAIKLMAIANTLITISLVSNETYSDFSRDILSKILTLQPMYRFFQCLLYLQKILIILAFFYSSKNQQKHILHSTAVSILQHLHIIAEIDLMFSGFILLLKMYQNIPNFVLSISVNVYCTIFMENYSDRKQLYYCSSASNSLFFKFSIIFIYFYNSVNLIIWKQIYLLSGIILIGVLLCCWFAYSGYKLYLYPQPKFMLIFFISLFMTLSLAVTQKLALHQISLDISSIVPIILSLFICCGILLLFQNKQNRSIIQQYRSKFNVKDLDLYLNELISNPSRTIYDQCLLAGLFDVHEMENCQNQRCYTNIKNLYDTFLMAILPSLFTKKQKQSILNQYIKCQYQQKIFCQSSSSLIIDFCQFLISQFGYFYTPCLLLSNLPYHSLTILQKVKIKKLKNSVEDLTISLNKQLYQSKLYLQQIIECQQHFDEVMHKNQNYIINNIQIWDQIQKDQINYTFLQQKMKNSYSMIETIKTDWLKISKYFKVQKRWKFIYLNFLLYVLNHKIDAKGSDQLNQKINQLFTPIQVKIQNQDQKEQLIKQQYLFGKNSFYIHANMKNRELLIKRVSSNFTNITDYIQQDVKGSKIGIIMNDKMRIMHDDSVLQWLQQGSQIKQNLYEIRFTECLTKSGNVLPVIKYFKLFYNPFEQSNIEFTCMLLINKIQQSNNFDDKKIFTRPMQISNFNIQQQFNQPNIIFTLNNQNNIFLKEQHLMIKQQMIEIIQIKFALRSLLAFLLGFVLILSFVTKNDSDSVINYSNQYIGFMNMYRFPMNLGMNYMKYFLDVGNKSKLANQIIGSTKQMQNFATAPLTIKTLFDQSLNVPRLFTPFRNNTMNKGAVYNQIDLFYLILSSISSLSTLPINRTGYNFVMYNSYIKPSYDQLINSTKYKFHKSFQGLFNNMLIKEVSIAFMTVAAITIVLIFTLCKIQKFFGKRQNIFEIIIEFNASDLRNITRYWQKQQLHFSKLYQQNYKFYCHKKQSFRSSFKSLPFGNSRSLQLSQQINLQKEAIGLNKRTKNIIYQKNAKNQKKRVFFIVTVSLFFIILLITSIEIASFRSITQMKQFQNAGFYFLQYFPTASLLGFGSMQKFYSQMYPNQVQFDVNRYEDALGTMLIFGQGQYIGSIIDTSSEFFQKQKNYFFNNPCTYNPSVLISTGIDVNKCLVISNKTFNSGLSSYFRFAFYQIHSYMYNKSTVNSTQMDELTISLTVCAVYVLDAITTWANQFSSKMINHQSSNSTVYMIIALFIIGFQILIFQCFLFKKLNKQEQFIFKIFNYMMPEYIIINEKVTKQKLIMEGIIKTA